MKYLIDESTLTALGDAIRTATGSSKTYTPAEMVECISRMQFDPTVEVPITWNEGYSCSTTTGGYITQTSSNSMYCVSDPILIGNAQEYTFTVNATRPLTVEFVFGQQSTSILGSQSFTCMLGGYTNTVLIPSNAYYMRLLCTTGASAYTWKLSYEELG